MSSSRARAVRWWLVCALAAAALALEHRPSEPSSSSATTRLLAPIAPLLASLQWLRVERAMHAGRPELVLARSEALLEFDARSSQAHVFLSIYFGFTLASPERERDPARRAHWLRVALELCRRGEASVGDPSTLARWQGELLARAAQQDEQLAWPGGVGALWNAAAENFARAASLGDATAAEREQAARQAAHAAR